MKPLVPLRHRLLRHVIVPLALTWLLGGGDRADSGASLYPTGL